MKKEFNPQDYVGKTYYHYDGGKVIIAAVMNDKYFLLEGDDALVDIYDLKEQIDYGELRTADELIREMSNVIIKQKEIISKMREVIEMIEVRDRYNMSINKGLEIIKKLI